MHPKPTAIASALTALVLSAAAAVGQTAQPAPSAPTGAVSAELARKCRALAIRAHPTERAGTTPYAQLQRDYFQDCIAKRGNMPE